jgi:hypothetical protein
MKLARPFVRLPLRFDVARLSQEVSALPASAWDRHPTGFAGNSAARLISVGGQENDTVAGAMQPTAHLLACPYVQQVLASFGVVWSRSRLMKLAPGAIVPEHADVNYHWFTRVRIHIPIWTQPEVLFYCGDQVVNMKAGEAWVFDNWRLHKVENRSREERVHLVADTTGSAAFWQMVEAGQLGRLDRVVPFQPERPVPLMLERHNSSRVMPPAEMEHLLADLAQELVDANAGDTAGTPDVRRFQTLIGAFCYDWRQLWSLYADSGEGTPAYLGAIEALRAQAASIAGALRMRTNRLGVMKVLNARVQYAVTETRDGEVYSLSRNHADNPAGAGGGPVIARNRVRFDRPVFIVAAPRSGSTLLFETLACTPQLWTVGGEAHWLVEGSSELCPGAPGIDSNRIGAEHATPEVRDLMLQRIVERLQRPSEAERPEALGEPLRFLEKTPKNALRIPFFNRVFPDALFVFLWRDPRQNISSIIEAWKSRRWVTYRRLEGWDGPWSLLLPPGWQALRGKPLEEIAAYQWNTANRIILDDLASLGASRALAVCYDDLLRDPAAEIRRICSFAGLGFDAALQQRVAAPLPPSRFTHTAPAPDKWRMNADSIERVLPPLQATWDALKRFQAAKR